MLGSSTAFSSAKRYPYARTPAALAAAVHLRRGAWNVMSPKIAAPRLYSAPSPNVAFPVPNGEPSAGAAG